MADSVLSTDLLERYGAIEQAYCEERWSSVIHDGQTLLSDLSSSGEEAPEGLKERLQLLMAHAFLYGLGDRDSAEDLYQVVLRSGAEASLRQIAEQGLQQCALPGASPESQEEPPEQEMDPLPDAVTPSTVGTSLWPEASAEPPADPASSLSSGSALPLQESSAPLQGLQDDWGTAASQPASSEDGALGWLTVEAKPVPQDPAALPVMPWLETDAAVTSTAPLAFQPEQASGAEDLAVRRDEEEPASGLPASESGQMWAPQEAAPAQAGPSLEDPSADPAAALGLPPPIEQDAPLPSDGATASLQLSAAGFDQPPGRSQPGAAFALAAQDVRSDLLPASFDAPQDQPSHLDAGEAFPPTLTVSTAEERLVPDVVEEPELIELHLADSLHREELLLQAVAEDPAPLPEAEGDLEVQAAAAVGMPAGLDRRGSDDMSRGFQDRREEPPLELEPVLEPAPVEEPAPVPADSPAVVLSGSRLFSGPPEPVAEEDPELLMGLLKVEMG